METDHKDNFIEKTLFEEHLSVYSMASQLVFLRQNTFHLKVIENYYA